MTNGAPLAPVPYGIIHAPIALEYVNNLATADRLTVMQKILELQHNPRPDGHQSDDAYGKGLTRIMIEDPPYIIVYSVDDDEHRVVVVAIMVKRW